MNKELFDSMQKQMTPSPEVRAALNEKLTQSPAKRPVPWKKYGAVAACAALVIGCFSVYRLSQDPRYWTVVVDGFQRNAIVDPQVPLHSYVMVEGLSEYTTDKYTTENTVATNDIGGSTETGGSGGSGDRDVEMTVNELEEIMRSYGFTEEEVKEYKAIGYQMTWAKWWQFIHQQQDSGKDNPFNLEDLKAFSQQELFINTGALPGGAYIGDVPSQDEAVDAYQKLMDRFNGTYPDWYGGAYIDSSAALVVCLVESKDPGDKTLELQVLDWTDNGRVAFTSGKYSLGYLLDLQRKVCDALYEMGLDYGCGADEEYNRLDLILSSVTEEALALLARLDPDDDAIYVQVGQFIATNDLAAEDPAVHHAMPGGITPPVPEDDADLIADEPYYDPNEDVSTSSYTVPGYATERTQPAVVQSVPEEDVSPNPERPVHGDSSGYTLAYDPDVGFIYPAQ